MSIKFEGKINKIINSEQLMISDDKNMHTIIILIKLMHHANPLMSNKIATHITKNILFLITFFLS